MKSCEKGKIILVTGGARSGKSSYAESLCRSLEDSSGVSYIATSVPFDDEMKLRVEKHKKSRPQNWTTFEGYKNIDRHILLSESSTFILDCVTMMINNLIYDRFGDDFDTASKKEKEDFTVTVKDEFSKMIEAAVKSEKNLVIVTNELGMGVIPFGSLNRYFVDLAGYVNQLIASLADEVYLCVSSIPVKIK